MMRGSEAISERYSPIWSYVPVTCTRARWMSKGALDPRHRALPHQPLGLVDARLDRVDLARQRVARLGELARARDAADGRAGPGEVEHRQGQDEEHQLQLSTLVLGEDGHGLPPRG